MEPWRTTGWLPRLEVVDWPALADCQTTHDAAATILSTIHPEEAPAHQAESVGRRYADALADVGGIVEVAVTTLEVGDGRDALTAARRRIPPPGTPALERDARRLRHLFAEVLAPRVEYLGSKVPAALVEVHDALGFSAESVVA